MNFSQILLQNQEHLKTTCGHHRRLFHSEACTTAKVAAPLSSRAVMFSRGLVASFGKSCSSKSSQPHCNGGVFTAEPKFLTSIRLRPVWHVSPERNTLSIRTPANIKSRHVALICSLPATPLLNLVHLFSGKGQSYYCR